MGIRGEIFSTRSSAKSEKRTYFFNVKENRAGDIFLNVVESKKHGEADFERHQIVVFQEDMEEFLQAMDKAVAAMKPAAAAAKRAPWRTGPIFRVPGTGGSSSGESGRDPASE
ncbi:MAG: PUR family DNA/RNA-binding protein [Spirochaetia bacterium]|jgi:hypothetical protein|nr:PUR family DNA/RNA-binding protein [Spirochaetia bacterium]